MFSSLENFLTSLVVLISISGCGGLLKGLGYFIWVHVSFSLVWFLEWVTTENVHNWSWFLILSILRLSSVVLSLGWWRCRSLILLGVHTSLLLTHICSESKHFLALEAVRLCWVFLTESFLRLFFSGLTPFRCFVCLWCNTSVKRSWWCVIIWTQDNGWVSDDRSRGFYNWFNGIIF